MVDISLSSNATDLIVKLQRFRNKGLFVAHSKAEQRTVEKAQVKAKKAMEVQLDKPAKATVNSVRREFRQAGKIKAGIGSSKVFVADFLVDELWFNTVTEYGNPRKLETKNPQGGRDGLILPTKRLRNPAGNLRAFRSRNALKRLRDTKSKYFEVSEGSRIKGKLGYLKPGIYEVRKLKRGNKIRLVVAYSSRRRIVPKWKFREVVLDCYTDHWPLEFNSALSQEISKVFS